MAQVKQVQIIFDDDDIRIENLTNDIKYIKKKMEALRKKYLKKKNLRLICFYNAFKKELNAKQRELDEAEADDF